MMLKELVVVSGKGGTGKTSITASFAALATNKVIADCDVDAADLHLVLDTKIVHRESFTGGSVAVIDMDKCNRCGACQYLCRFKAINEDYSIDLFACEGCAVCLYNCPRGVVTMKEKIPGEWFISETRLGTLVHARLNPGEENSGKLVSIVRSKARSIAEKNGFDLVLIDGSPGIGCPVIASVTGASLVLAVTEPTLSGLHDLDRILSLAGHFQIPSVVCINKYDINPDMADSIEKYCDEKTIPVIGRVPFDSVVTKAQVAGVSVVEYSGGGASLEIRKLWREVCYRMEIAEKDSERV
jgi:MinD superfamily P-loop ATPase